MAAPTSFIATVTNTTASVSFIPPPGTIINCQHLTDNGSAHTTVSLEQPDNTTYSILLKADDANDPIQVALAAPTDLVATPGYFSVSLAFIPPAGTVSNYQYSLNGGYVALSPAQTTSPIVIHGLSAVPHTITVRAMNGDEVGAASSSVTATPSSSALWSIRGLQLWYDGADPHNTGVAPTNGEHIAAWKNKARTGTTYDAVTTVGGNAATYNAAYKALLFNKTPYTTGGYPGNPAAETAFIVFNTPNNGRNFALVAGTNGSREYAFGYNAATGENTVGVVNAGVTWICGTPAGSYTVNTTAIATFKQSEGTAYASLYGQNGNAYSIGPMSYLPESTTWLGAETAFPDSMYIGYAMEIIIYNAVLSESEIALVQAYLYQKWVAPSINASV